MSTDLEQTRHFTTATGADVWFLHPERTPIRGYDLYIHSSRICRYGGAVEWTLLQHTALCVALARRGRIVAEIVPYVAVHDLHEVYVGDVVAALKEVLPEYKARIETPWEARVHHALGLCFPLDRSMKGAVKRIDIRALAIEMIFCQHPRAGVMVDRFVAAGEPIGDGEVMLARAIWREPPAVTWNDIAADIGVGRLEAAASQ